MIAGLVPLVKSYNVLVFYFMGEADPVGYFRPFALLSTKDGYKVDGSFPAPLIYDSPASSANLLIQDEVFHIWDRLLIYGKTACLAPARWWGTRVARALPCHGEATAWTEETEAPEDLANSPGRVGEPSASP